MPIRATEELSSHKRAEFATALLRARVGPWAAERIEFFYVEHFIEQLFPRRVECGSCDESIELPELVVQGQPGVEAFWLLIGRCDCGSWNMATSWSPELDDKLAGRSA